MIICLGKESFSPDSAQNFVNAHVIEFGHARDRPLWGRGFSCSGFRKPPIDFTLSLLGSRFFSWWKAATLFSAPPIADIVFDGGNNLMTPGLGRGFFLAFGLEDRHLVSRSAAEISAIIPHSSRLRRRSSSAGMALGGRSLVMTTWCPCWWRSLKVWKNSSWVSSLPPINWMSSMRRRSTLRYRSLNSLVCPLLMALTKSFMNFSELIYKILV